MQISTYNAGCWLLMTGFNLLKFFITKAILKTWAGCPFSFTRLVRYSNNLFEYNIFVCQILIFCSPAQYNVLYTKPINMQSINVKQVAKPTSVKKPDPKKVKLIFDYTPSADGIDFNLLVLLHGLGTYMLDFNCTPWAKHIDSLFLRWFQATLHQLGKTAQAPTDSYSFSPSTRTCALHGWLFPMVS